MAYLRFNELSDVYFFPHVFGGWECCGCRRAASVKDSSPRFDQIEDAIGHLQEHMRLGDRGVTYEVIDQVLGYADRPVDTTIEELVRAARESGGKVCTWDADVPADVRVSDDEMRQLAGLLEAEKES